MLHTHAQVPVIQLLGHLWGHLLAADAAAAAHAAATAAGGLLSNSGGGAAADLPESSSGSIAAALPGILAYLTNSLNSLNPAVKLEAARVLLRVSKASSSSSSSGDGLLSRMRLVGAVPPATAAAAIEALLELKGRLLVEAALEEVVSLVAAHLELLQVPTRLAVLQRLWPMIALLQSPTDRLTAFAHSWRAALDLAISSGSSSGASQGQPEGAAATLSAILSDPFLADVISERPAAAAAAAAAAATSGSGGGAPPDSSDAAAAAAGPTGGSTVSAAGGGGVSAAEVMGISGAAAGPTGGSDRERIVLSGSFSGSSSSRKLKLLKSAKGMLSSGAALASNMGGAIATAATTGLAAIPLPKWMEGPAPARMGGALASAATTVLAAIPLPKWMRGQHPPVTALQHSRACLHWEPLVPPPMPGNPPAPPLPPLASVNLTTVPVDAWLTLLQAACQAVRGVLRLHGYDSLKAIYRANGGRMLPQLSPWDASGSLARTAESAAAALQQLLARELAEWRGLAHAVRPRVLWVAAHYLELPNLFDESWGLLLAWLEDALLRSVKAEGDARCRQLAASARDGLLLKKWAMPQLSNLGRDKSGAQTTFDAAAASALVEMPEYRSDGLQVGLTVLQYLAWVVQASCAASAAAAAAAAVQSSSTAANGAAAAAAGPAEAVLARKLLELVKAVGAQDAAGVDTREWCKRMVRMLSAAADPAAAAAAGSGVAAAHAGGPAFAMAPPPPSSGPGAAKAALPSGYNAVAGFSALGFGGGDSSDDEDEGPAGLSREERLKRRLGLSKSGGGGGGSGRRRGGGNRHTADSSSDDDDNDAESSSSSSSSDESSKNGGSSGSDAAAGGSSDSDAGGPALHNPLSGLQLGGQSNNADGQTNAMTGGGIAGKERRAQRRAAKAAKKARKARAAAATFAVGAPDVASGVWGYPFGGPRSATLFISRRSRRHSAESGFRLDQAGFWDGLPGAASGWQELSGPNDPLVLAGRYSAAAGAGSAAGEISVVLRAFNRLPVDLEGVEVAVRLVGPARAERREASWMLPRLLPTEAAQHSFKLLPTGYGRLEVHGRLLLPVPQLASEAASAPALACQPLSISMAHLLSPPACPPASAQDMLALWASLPVQVELSGSAVWPGLDGLLLLLSALARQPLHCAWAHMLPVVCGAQAAFVACPTTHTADTLAIMVVAQLMPEPAAAAANAAAASAADVATVEEDGQQQQQQQLDAAGGLDGQQKQQQPGAQQQQQQQLRGAVQLVVRASSHEVLLAIQQQPEAWLRDISQGTLSLGVVAGAAPPRPSRGKTMLHPCIARLAQQLAAAAAVMPPPAAVPPLQLPPLPTFGKKLRAKADEEDSDADDEELPPTAEEAAAQQAALEKHAADCDKAREAHAAAKASRAGSVLRRAALAEWRRAACPSMT
ncbi:hypothetical protein OEZ85_013414 [Tetradesmus obliquus]|nr:hypothetical protein OEZ85_013414 [Tetradesmus obliquus]